MIGNIPTAILYDEESQKIMGELENLREKILEHDFELNRAGTNSTLYSIVDLVLSVFGSTSRAPSFLKRKILNYLVGRGRVPVSYVNVVWTKDVVSSSTLPYPVRRAEYPWAISKA
ncbi:MAG: hypothetical protein ACRD5H_12870, partial [Nitrososphaerales archaeon]